MLSAERVRALCERSAAGDRKAALAREFGISRETVYSYLWTSNAAGEVTASLAGSRRMKASRARS